jgi:hypothetical protein
VRVVILESMATVHLLIVTLPARARERHNRPIRSRVGSLDSSGCETHNACIFRLPITVVLIEADWSVVSTRSEIEFANLGQARLSTMQQIRKKRMEHQKEAGYCLTTPTDGSRIQDPGCGHGDQD